MPPDAELDYFDIADLARLRRQVKAALKDFERERAIYVEVGVGAGRWGMWVAGVGWVWGVGWGRGQV